MSKHNLGTPGIKIVRLVVLATVTMKVFDFGNVMPCILVEID
jgi:hypothetical protein